MKKRRYTHWQSDVFCFVFRDIRMIAIKDVKAYRKYMKDKQIMSLSYCNLSQDEENKELHDQNHPFQDQGLTSASSLDKDTYEKYRERYAKLIKSELNG